MRGKVLNDVKRGPLGNVIALHDFAEETPDIRIWFEYTVSFFEEYGLVPTKAAIDGPQSNKGNNNMLFKTAFKRLYETDFKNVQGIWFGAVPPNCEQEGLDSIFSTEIDVCSPNNKGNLVLCFDDSLTSFSHDLINNLTKDLSRFFKPRYGYCFQRPFKKGPKWYPLGVNVDLEWDDPERKLIGEWGRTYHVNDGKYKTGDLRDIYPMNVLSQAHQERMVNGQPFFEWIQAQPYRGTLEPLTPDLWAWWVEHDYLPQVREDLRPTGMVLCI